MKTIFILTAALFLTHVNSFAETTFPCCENASHFKSDTVMFRESESISDPLVIQMLQDMTAAAEMQLVNESGKKEQKHRQ